MPKFLRIVGLLALFVFSYLFFVYSMFPMSAVKDRVVSEVEKSLGPGYEIAIKDLDVGFWSGVVLKKVALSRQEQGQSTPLWDSEKVSLNVHWLSLLWGRTKVDFSCQSGKGEISGDFAKQENNWAIQVDLDNVDLSQFPILQVTTGLQMHSKIDGKVHIDFDPRQLMRTSGEMLIQLEDWSIQASGLKLGEMGTFPVPDLVLSKGNSKIEAKIDKGAMSVDALQLQGGDLMIDVKGKIYLSQEVSRYRMNLQGNFSMSPKMSESLSLIGALIDKQKSPDGSYPLTVTGQFSKPNIKIGTFVLPF